MNIKTILVHVAGDDQAEKRLSVTIQLARTFGAHITAVYIPRSLDEGTFGRGVSASYRTEMERLASARAEAAKAHFDAAVSRYGISHRWVQEEGDDHDILESHARAADLIVLSQSRKQHLEDFFSSQLSEELIMTSGVPALVLPLDWTPAPIGENIMIAWKSTRETVRAVRDSLAFLARAEKVSVLSVGGEGDDLGIPAEQARDYISRHGFSVEIVRDFDNRSDAGDVILNHLDDQKADLLVMGAYGQPKWRQFVLGGATSTVLSKMRVPTLFSH